MDKLTVSMPVYNTPTDLLERAVDSVLSQTFKNLRLILVNDGGETPSLTTKDSRLFVFNMDSNRGRYFADAIVLNACRTPFFTAHDSDDWSEPERYEEMIAIAEHTGADVVAGATRFHFLGGGTMVHKPNRGPAKGFSHLWHTSALYKTESLRYVAYPKYPVSVDVFHASVMSIVSQVALYQEPRYHWEERAGSLTTSSEMGVGSQARKQVEADMTRIIRHIYRKTRTAKDKKQIARTIIEQEISRELSVLLRYYSDSCHDFIVKGNLHA